MRLTALLPVALLTGCPTKAPQDLMGNFAVDYADNLRVYINDELLATVVSGEDTTVTWNGESFLVSTLCSDEGTSCPSETGWRQVAVDQPWGSGYTLLNFVDLDTDRGTPGARLGGLLADDGTYTMLSGLAVGGDEHCIAVGVGTVTGAFSSDATSVSNGIITWGWAAGCAVGDVQIGANLRLETDYTASRVSDYDVSSVTAAAPIDETGATVDPENPEESYSADSGG